MSFKQKVKLSHAICPLKKRRKSMGQNQLWDKCEIFQMQFNKSWIEWQNIKLKSLECLPELSLFFKTRHKKTYKVFTCKALNKEMLDCHSWH